ncbi:hypothetical protein ES705_21718 [subsurface metagenome]
MECWNIEKIYLYRKHYSIIPLFHHSRFIGVRDE